jgi:hypothetical protein
MLSACKKQTVLAGLSAAEGVNAMEEMLLPRYRQDELQLRACNPFIESSPSRIGRSS